jgi:predicted nucleotidyltransferase
MARQPRWDASTPERATIVRMGRRSGELSETDDILQMLAAYQRAFERFGVRSLALFGSVARDEAGPDSDVDFLVEFEGPATSTDTSSLASFWTTSLPDAWTSSRVPLSTLSIAPRLRRTHIMMSQSDPPPPFTPPRLILADLTPGVKIVVPAGLRIGESIPIPEQVQGRWITIGAAPGQDIVVRDQPAGIGGSHCRMTLRSGAFLLQGRLHSSGWALNGERFYDCTARPLRDGDLITIGKHVTFRFVLQSTAER